MTWHGWEEDGVIHPPDTSIPDPMNAPKMLRLQCCVCKTLFEASSSRLWCNDKCAKIYKAKLRKAKQGGRWR